MSRQMFEMSLHSVRGMSMCANLSVTFAATHYWLDCKSKASSMEISTQRRPLLISQVLAKTDKCPPISACSMTSIEHYYHVFVDG